MTCTQLAERVCSQKGCVASLTERQPTSLVARSADVALTAGVRSLRVAFDGAAAARALFSGELEALSAFGTRRYTAQAMQVRVAGVAGRCSAASWTRSRPSAPAATLYRRCRCHSQFRIFAGRCDGRQVY